MTPAAPVLAIGLDAAEPRLIEQWIASNQLPTLRSLREQGGYGRLSSPVHYGQATVPTSSTERLWVMFATGQPPERTGYWGPVHYHAEDYRIRHDPIHGAYDYHDYPLFYAQGDRLRVRVLDVPVAALSDQVQGVQVLGWGGHAPHTPSHSQPPEVLPQLLQQYGKNPLLHQDYGCWWDREYVTSIQQRIQASAATRSRLCQDWLRAGDWDLALVVFGETHTAGHDLWHSQDPTHPLHHHSPNPQALLQAYQAVDHAIGELLSTLPPTIQVVVFSLHGMGPNVTDMNSMTFLPECLYRWNFPGRQGLQGRSQDTATRLPYRKSWAGEVWQRRHHANPVARSLLPWVPSRWDHWCTDLTSPLASPYVLRDRQADLHWMPALWYSPTWPQMRAFALPAFADGLIRLNLKGREAQGLVELADYDQVCAELTTHLQALTDAHTARPLVQQVVRTRSQADALRCDAALPEADLIVIWQEDVLTDRVEHPQWGRIGPLTYYRPGGHRADGFRLIKSPHIPAQSDLPTQSVLTLGADLLALLG